MLLEVHFLKPMSLLIVMTADEVIFLLLNLQKNWINIFVLDLDHIDYFFVYRCERLGR